MTDFEFWKSDTHEPFVHVVQKFTDAQETIDANRQLIRVDAQLFDARQLKKKTKENEKKKRNSVNQWPDESRASARLTSSYQRQTPAFHERKLLLSSMNLTPAECD